MFPFFFKKKKVTTSIITTHLSKYKHDHGIVPKANKWSLGATICWQNLPIFFGFQAPTLVHLDEVRWTSMANGFAPCPIGNGIHLRSRRVQNKISYRGGVFILWIWCLIAKIIGKRPCKYYPIGSMYGILTYLYLHLVDLYGLCR